MPIVVQCAEPGCETLTMGPYCIEHEQLPVQPHYARLPSTAVLAELPTAHLDARRQRLLRRASAPTVAARPHP